MLRVCQDKWGNGRFLAIRTVLLIRPRVNKRWRDFLWPFKYIAHSQDLGTNILISVYRSTGSELFYRALALFAFVILNNMFYRLF